MAESKESDPEQFDELVLDFSSSFSDKNEDKLPMFIKLFQNTNLHNLRSFVKKI